MPICANGSADRCDLFKKSARLTVQQRVLVGDGLCHFHSREIGRSAILLRGQRSKIFDAMNRPLA